MLSNFRFQWKKKKQSSDFPLPRQWKSVWKAEKPSVISRQRDDLSEGLPLPHNAMWLIRGCHGRYQKYTKYYMAYGNDIRAIGSSCWARVALFSVGCFSRFALFGGWKKKIIKKKKKGKGNGFQLLFDKVNGRKSEPSSVQRSHIRQPPAHTGCTE